MAIPKEPIVFLKATSCIQGPDDDVMLPKGSVKSDWEVELGVVIGTLNTSVPAEIVEAIGQCALATFSDARAALLPLTELTVNYGSLRIVAREMRGGAMIFVRPTNLEEPAR